MIPVPDRVIVTQLQRIDPDLSVGWVAPPGRFAVFHALQVPGNYDETVDKVATAVRQQAAQNGYSVDLCDCAMAARDAVHAAKLVCYVTEEDGTFRPLDGRLIEKFERMDYYRRNWGLRNWQAVLKAKAEYQRASIERDRDDVWDTIRRDPVFARQVSDTLWGTKTRSMSVPEEVSHGDS